MYDYLREMCSYPRLYYKLAKVKKEIIPQHIDYGRDKSQYVLYFAPKGAVKNKIIVWIHGGGWNAGSPQYFEYVGQCFANEGYHCISLGYRLSPKNKYPAQIEDVCAGFNKGIEYLESIGVDCSQIIVTGPSAGAHLASILCYSQEAQAKYSVDIKNIVGFIGVAGPYCLNVKHIRTVQLLLMQLFTNGYDRTKAEPYSLIAKNHISMLLMQSRHDGLFDYSIAEKFHKKAVALGIKSELYEVTDRMNTHSAYSAGMFLEMRQNNKALDKLFSWVEGLEGRRKK